MHIHFVKSMTMQSSANTEQHKPAPQDTAM